MRYLDRERMDLLIILEVMFNQVMKLEAPKRPRRTSHKANLYRVSHPYQVFLSVVPGRTKSGTARLIGKLTPKNSNYVVPKSPQLPF